MAIKLDFSGFEEIPEYTKQNIARYIEKGLYPGSFIEACFNNNLEESLSRADQANLKALRAIVMFIMTRCPIASRDVTYWCNMDDEERRNYE